jgi:hypothetical protein
VKPSKSQYVLILGVVAVAGLALIGGAAIHRHVVSQEAVSEVVRDLEYQVPALASVDAERIRRARTLATGPSLSISRRRANRQSRLRPGPAEVRLAAIDDDLRRGSRRGQRRTTGNEIADLTGARYRCASTLRERATNGRGSEKRGTGDAQRT